MVEKPVDLSPTTKPASRQTASGVMLPPGAVDELKTKTLGPLVSDIDGYPGEIPGK